MKIGAKITPRQIILFTILVMASILFVGYASIKSINELQASNIEAKDAFELNAKVQSIVKDILIIETKLRGFVISEDPKFLSGVNDTLVGLKTRADELKMFLTTPYYQERLSEINRLVDAKMNFTDSIYETYKLNGKKASEQLVASGYGAELRDSILDFAGEVNSTLQESIKNHLEQNINQSNSVKMMELILSFGSVLIILTLSIMIIKKVRQQEILILELTQMHEKEKEAKEEIAKISSEIEDLYNLAPCGYHSLDAEGYFSTINKTELDWLGFSKEEVLGKKKFEEILDEEDKKVFKEQFSQFKIDGNLNEIRLNLKNKTGETFPVLLSSLAIYDKEGNYESCRSTMFDISLQDKYQQELKDAKSLADRSLLIKEQFLANMSHEIRTPLNAILGFSNLMQKTKLRGEQKEFADFIKTSSHNLLAIVNDILDISKIEAGMIRFESKPFHLSQLLESVKYMFAAKCMEKSVELTFKIDENITDRLEGDTVRLTQILMNLVGNAVKFTSKGSITISVNPVSESEDEVLLNFSVKDTGIGIPAESMANIFERFTQAEESTTRKFGGTGLGLAISKNLVELQGGKMHVASTEGVGSNFSFQLPFKIADANEFIFVVNGNNELIFENGIKLLVVEDNSINQMLIQYFLKQWDLKFDIVENGKLALEKIRQHKFDLILMDIQMPEMNGYETAQIIRDELKLDIPIIAMTAHALPGEKQKCIDAGMNDYISKPLDEQELKTIIHQNLHSETGLTTDPAPLVYIDYTLMNERFLGNISFIQDLIKEIIIQFSKDIESLQQAISDKNDEMLKDVCHHARNTSIFFKPCSRISETLLELEILAEQKENEIAWDQLELVFNKIKNTPEKVTAESIAILSKIL